MVLEFIYRLASSFPYTRIMLKKILRHYWLHHWLYQSFLDRPFHNFKTSRSGDKRILFSSGTSYDGFWSFKIVKGSVGLFNSHNCSRSFILRESALLFFKAILISDYFIKSEWLATMANETTRYTVEKVVVVKRDVLRSHYKWFVQVIFALTLEFSGCWQFWSGWSVWRCCCPCCCLLRSGRPHPPPPFRSPRDWCYSPPWRSWSGPGWARKSSLERTVGSRAGRNQENFYSRRSRKLHTHSFDIFKRFPLVI